MSAGMPFVMTTAMKAALHQRGFAAADIEQMTPGEAHKLLTPEPITVASLAPEPVWIGWKHEPVRGRITKVPYNPKTSEKAQSNNPATWSTRDVSETWTAANKGAGVGVMFGHDIGDARLAGIDLDTCRDQNSGEIAPWAQAVIDRFQTYCEISPSGTGVKLFFAIRQSDLPAVEAIFGGADNYGRKFVRGNGGAHEPAIEIYRSHRFFTVTGAQVGETEEIRAASPAAIQWLLRDCGPKFAGKDRAADDVNDDRLQSDWPTDVRDHDELVSLAMRFVMGGMNPGMVRNYLRASVAKADFGGNEDRRERRLDDISRAVSSAEGKVEADTAQKEAKAPATELEGFDAGDEDEGEDVGPREWLLGTSFCRGYLSGLISAGAGGKTTIRIVQAVALAAKRMITGEHIHVRSRVLVVCLEDDLKELRRRVKAARIHHGIPAAEVKGFLRLTSPRKMKIAELSKNGAVIEGKLLTALRREIDEHQLDLVIIDPVVKAHSVGENDNAQIDIFAGMLADLAVEKNIAVDLLAHERKGGVSGTAVGDANRSRGASSLKDAQRLAKTLTPMSAEEAAALGISDVERVSLVRMDNAKVNIAPPSRAADWFKIVSVNLGNSTEAYPNGDNVQAAERWEPPAMFGGMELADLNRVLKRLGAGLDDGQRYSLANAAKGRAAWTVVQEQFPNLTPERCRAMIALWQKNAMFEVGEYDDPTRRDKRIGILSTKELHTPGNVE
jgi:hypothetical protein